MQGPSQEARLRALLAQAHAAIGARRLSDADALSRQAVLDHAGNAEAWLLRARVCQLRGDADAMLAAAQRALGLDGGAPIGRLQEIEALILLGRMSEALPRLRALEIAAGEDYRLLQHVGEFYTHCARNDDAERVYRRAVEMQPANAGCLYNLATALIGSGRLDEAEAALNKVIEIAPQDADAYYNRATLRRQTANDNHVAEIEAALRDPKRRPESEVQLCYALAKELEDLGRDEQAFAHLKRGADRRRATLSYKVDDDVATMSRIAAAFDARTMANAPKAATGGSGPIFVTGLPRSGTTLVDRILSSHSQVASLGEITDFAQALIRTAGPAPDKATLIAKSAAIDFGELGRAYLARVAGYGRAEPFLVDKTPLNFLYAGLIALALPNARIVHVARDAMDVCYAMYKTLFRMGYPFSYDFRDLAAYAVAHDRLMTHWRAVMPGRIVDVRYEDLVHDQEGVSRRLVAACGLSWEDACFAFERNESASLTASAAQVRQPIYASSVGLWRRYERELAPLAELLKTGGLEVA